MQLFLSQTAKYIAENHENPGEIKIILPSKRASLFLKKELSTAYQKAIQSPEITTLDNFIADLSTLKTIDNLDQLFILHDALNSLLKKEGKENEDLDDFLTWAPTLLSDFSAIDSYLVDGDALFENINDVRAIEVWNVDGQAPTQTQLEYIALWKRYGKLYDAFRKKLLAKGKGTASMISRSVAEKIGELIFDESKKCYFVGLGALNSAEEKIINQFVNAGQAEVLFDGDRYFVQNEQQEAGKFIRKYKHLWSEKQNELFSDTLSSNDISINIHSCSSSYAQSVLLNDILGNVQGKQEHTAIILNKEDLLLPVLNAIPNNIDAVNVTMGYPIKDSPASTFFELTISLWDTKVNNTRKDSKSTVFYYKKVLDWLKHPYSKQLFKSQDSLKELQESIISKNKIYLSKRFIERHIEDVEITQLVFGPPPVSVEDCCNVLLNLIQLLKSKIQESTEDENEPLVESSVIIEFLFHFTKVFNKISKYAKQYTELNNSSLKSFRYLIKQLSSRDQLDFYGEPIQGLQIMGMLESRSLDFDHVILCSVNDGILPAGKRNNSFIPFDLTVQFGLPTYREHDALAAYHFYRLISRAKKIDLLYYNSSDDFGAAAEKSRFIEQLVYELPKTNKKAQLNTFNYNPKVESKKLNNDISYNEEIKKLVHQKLVKGLSPSAFNKLCQCPLDFYFRYVLKLGELEDVEENINSSTFGTCVHNTLEHLHNMFLNIRLTDEHFGQWKRAFPSILKKEFLSHFSEDDLKFGNNFIQLELGTKYISKFLDFERQLAREHEFIILGMEEEIEEKILLQIDGQEIESTITGKIDCICTIDGELNLIDYKTGKVESKALTNNNIEGDFLDKKCDKSVQLLFYSWLYFKKHPEVQSLKSSIYSFKNTSEGFMAFSKGKNRYTKEEILDLFPKILELGFKNRLALNQAIVHETKSKFCEYCN